MWDQTSNKEFLIGTNPDSELPLWWDGSEPLWITLQKLGQKVFMYFWPGKHFLIAHDMVLVVLIIDDMFVCLWICKLSDRCPPQC